MPARFAIRVCEPGDLPRVTALTNHNIAVNPAHFSTEPETEDETRDNWRRHRERYPWLVAEEHASDEWGGFLAFARAAPWKPRHAYRWTTEVAIYVRPEAQRRGVATALYRTLFDLLARQGYLVVLAGVVTPNPASERLHEKAGMAAVGELAPAGFKLGAWRPVRYYQKNLAPLDHPEPPPEPRTVDEALKQGSRPFDFGAHVPD
ncbi:MAG: GNAT family N-acetyltransferase [Phycisphaerales bacterium JB040]